MTFCSDCNVYFECRKEERACGKTDCSCPSCFMKKHFGLTLKQIKIVFSNCLSISDEEVERLAVLYKVCDSGRKGS